MSVSSSGFAQVSHSHARALNQTPERGFFIVGNFARGVNDVPLQLCGGDFSVFKFADAFADVIDLFFV